MNTLIIVICALLLLAYLGEISSNRTKVPVVILLLLMGWIVRGGTTLFELNIPDLDPILPVLGTIGLILIVLEGSLELKINLSKKAVIRNSSLMAISPMILLTLIIAFAFSFYADVSFHTGLANALPFAVVSSSIAIPAAKNISRSNREFVIYESSLSDILGVLFFNFIIATELLTIGSLGLFALQVILVILISFFSVIGLSYLLGRIPNHITYAPIILLVILIYSLAKAFDLSGLVFILVFGLFLGNISSVRRSYILENIVRRVDSLRLDTEVEKFKVITVEATFLVRSLFFLLLGFTLSTDEFLNLQTLPWAAGIVLLIIGSRWAFLRIFKIPVIPLLYFSPRGLITILLLMSVGAEHNIFFVNESLLVQVIILSVFAMMVGLIRYRKEQ